MALSLRAATGGSSLATAVASMALTFPAGTATDDLVYFIISINAAVTAPVAAGWTPVLTSDGAGFSIIVGFRTIQAGDTAPTVTWTTTGKAAWTTIGLAPGAGAVASHSGFGTYFTNFSGATSFTPNSYAAGALTGTSVLLSAFKTGGGQTTAITATPPTNWTEPANGDNGTSTTNSRQVNTEVSYQLAQTGTITPGAETSSVSSTGMIGHAFAVETGGGGAAFIADASLVVTQQARNRAALY